MRDRRISIKRKGAANFAAPMTFDINLLLYERVLRRIHHAGRLVESDILNAEVTEQIEEELSVVTKRNCAVVRITLFN